MAGGVERIAEQVGEGGIQTPRNSDTHKLVGREFRHP
jgi:hypothetical protein